MSDADSTQGSAEEEAPARAEAAPDAREEAGAENRAAEAAAAKKAAKPARELPSEDDLARWIAGDDLPSLAHLFNLLNTKTFDAMMMQVRKEELLPQHWQVITALHAPEDAEFFALPEVDRLRGRVGDAETADRRIENLKAAWQELRGKRPSLWTVSDLFSAIRRIVDKQREVEFHALLSAIRDVWRDLTLPHGREQLEVLWACLDLVRSKTKK